jgi:hypothetical protein
MEWRKEGQAAGHGILSTACTRNLPVEATDLMQFVSGMELLSLQYLVLSAGNAIWSEKLIGSRKVPKEVVKGSPSPVSYFAGPIVRKLF